MEDCVFNSAIVRLPSPNFAEGLTTSGLPAPDYSLALTQHEAYCQALEQLGLTVVRLPADHWYPDSTFVEDTAVVTERGAVLTRPGAPPRQGEVEGMRTALSKFYYELYAIDSPGTLDGGDVCQVEDHFFIGVSARTNDHGATQLANILHGFGYTATLVNINKPNSSLLHLKSGLAYLGERRLVLDDSLGNRDEFRDFEVIRLDAAEAYAANCLAFSKTVLVASGYPRFESQLRQLGYHTIALDTSEFRKMDGGLSCLSLRF
jgi:dimethylargininase